MMKPEDITNQRFEKSAKGYKTEEVDEFLDRVFSDYVKLQQDNADLEHKLEVLADKLEEYRESEESLKSVLIGAQKLGDSIVREARAKAEVMTQEAGTKASSIISDAETRAEIIVSDARNSAENMLGNTEQELKKERETLDSLNDEVKRFKNNLLDMYRQHLELISKLTDEETEENIDIAEEVSEDSEQYEATAESISGEETAQ